MKTLAHISDLHFGRTDPLVVEGLLADLAAAQPHLIIVSGDLTQKAQHREFRAAKDFLDRLPAPYLVIPGNHDVPPVNIIERFLAPFARYRRFIQPDICPSFEEPDLAVLGINTARRFRWRWNWALGSISKAQIARVAEFFGGMPDTTFKILVTHHPFLAPPDTPHEDLAAHASEAIPVFEAAGVDLILSGHLHRGYRGEVNGQKPGLHRSVLVLQAATATSTRLRHEPNAYNHILLEGRKVGFRVRSWDGARFTGEATSWFEKESDRWLTLSGAAQAVSDHGQ
jgi:3',5'-cyclic AMP phosphodiesterase CpdA